MSVRFNRSSRQLPQIRRDEAQPVLDRGLSVQRGSLFVARNIVLAFWTSVILHLLVLLGGRSDLRNWDFGYWFVAFGVVDVIMIGLALTPIVAVARRKLAWNDPIAIFSISFLGMVGTFFGALVIDPTYTAYRLSFYGRLPQFYANSEYLVKTALQAELLFSLFLLIVLYINRHSIALKDLVPSKAEINAASIAFGFWFTLGVVGWLTLWSGRSYFESITVTIGSDATKIFESGEARNAILSTIGLIGLSLGVAGGKGFVTRSTRSLRTLPLLGAIGVSIAADLPSGSRIGIVIGAMLLLYLASLFRYHTRSIVWVSGILIGDGLIAAVTFLRGNSSIAGTASEVVKQLVTNEAGLLYAANLDSPASVLFSADRVSAFSIVLDRLASGESYLYGTTLVAGVIDWLSIVLDRLGLGQILASIDRSWANQQILIWIYGTIVPGGTLPPSVPGEFYMQGGPIIFILLSLAFGKVFLWLRTILAQSDHLIIRWGVGVFLFRLAMLVPTEVSPLFEVIIYLLPVASVYLVVYYLLERSTRRTRWLERSQ